MRPLASVALQRLHEPLLPNAAALLPGSVRACPGTLRSITLKHYNHMRCVRMQGLDHAEQLDRQSEGAEPCSDQPHGCPEW